MKIQLKADHIFIAPSAIDFRKGVNSLCALVLETFSVLPQAGLFIFYNKARNQLKILGWHHNGFVLIQKILETGKFFVSLKDTSTLTITEQQLGWLLVGLDWQLMSSQGDCDFDYYF